MGSRLFQTLVGVGISLGATSTGCLGQTNEADETAAPAPGGAGGAESQNQATTASATSATTATTGAHDAVTTGSTSGDGTDGSAHAVASTNASGGSGGADNSGQGGSGGAGDSGATAGGGPDWGVTGASGEAGAHSDPFCDTTWPTTKGNPPIPECADPHNECEDEPLRCLIVVGEFACDGHYDRAHAPLCVNGAWVCEPGLVPATECKCLAPLAEGHVCTRDGVVPEGQQP